MYQAVNISYRTRDQIILRDINVALKPGAFTAIVGPNGAGKSTLLKVMAHEHQSYQGEVIINGKPVRKYKAKELSRVRAVLPQASSIHFSFTVEQIVMLGRYGHPAAKKENDQILEEILSLTGLESFRERNYLTLSGGEKQRVQLARVLAQVWQETVYPRYILLDEPTSSMDIAQQQSIFTLAKKVCERNIGVMAIVHDLNQAILFADDLYFLRNGKTIAFGDAREVFTKSNIEETFCCRVNVYHDPCNNCPYIIPERELYTGTPQKFSIIQ
jgi:iron complex transport system ATP-binding protein